MFKKYDTIFFIAILWVLLVSFWGLLSFKEKESIFLSFLLGIKSDTDYLFSSAVVHHSLVDLKTFVEKSSASLVVEDKIATIKLNKENAFWVSDFYQWLTTQSCWTLSYSDVVYTPNHFLVDGLVVLNERCNTHV